MSLLHQLKFLESTVLSRVVVPGVNEKRKVFMRVDERLFYIF